MRIRVSKKDIVLVCFGALFVIFNVAIANYVVVQRYSRYILPESVAENGRVGIVFGGGVSDTEPLPLLKDRLDTAKQLLDNNEVDKLILSGDNRTLDYNEPAIMTRYLIQKGVSEEQIQQDFAGRSTYETCERAKRIFGLDEAILISERTHLPRAIYLCRSFDIKTYGIASDGEAASGLQIGQRWREVLASNKAIFNTYIAGEQTVLGEPIDYFSF
jgi:vancomycin permeability regulator SanA